MRNPHVRKSTPVRTSRTANGLSLIELILALGITAMVTVALCGLTSAVQSAWTISRNYHEVCLQGRAVLDRIRWMVGQAGTYRIDGGRVRLGVEVIARTTDGVVLPEILVVWSGGRSGGIQEKRQPTLVLPRINELVIYVPDPGAANRLVEIQFPSNTSTIDFASSGFQTQILSLIAGSTADQRLMLADRLRVCRLSESGASIGCLRFELLQKPTEAQVTNTVVGSDQWHALPWSQGMGFSRGGMRQATVRIELQLETVNGASLVGVSSPTAIPIPGSASVRYAYRA